MHSRRLRVPDLAALAEEGRRLLVVLGRHRPQLAHGVLQRNQLEGQIGEKTGYECRATVLGHIQRGGSPVAFDRVLGTRFGVAAIDAASNGDFGKMVALHGTRIERVPLDDALREPKLLDPDFYATAEVFFG